MVAITTQLPHSNLRGLSSCPVRTTAILDREMYGWYPGYWEYVKALNTITPADGYDDWRAYLPRHIGYLQKPSNLQTLIRVLYNEKMEFPEPHIHLPQSSHTHTFILLHGRGSNGPEFAEELFSSITSKGPNLAACLPNWRWVFPTSRNCWSDRFQEEMCVWFDAYSLDDIHERQELQIAGLRESVTHILSILNHEIEILGGKTSHVYLGGISQGMATALWTLFCATSQIHQPLGGFVGFCGWLPFARQIEEQVQSSDALSEQLAQRSVTSFFLNTISGSGASQTKETIDASILSTPVFLSHGTDDAWVSVDLGRQAARVLQQIRIPVQWHEFAGAEEDGHWVKEPEGFDQILHFLEACSSHT
ncbi:hypothetical protein ABOM_001311 [Aspergillus bombycis]|uniref:Phospholipase/carboxylesterase/thioesterase domain-containing protein n=1 Tax=Aspergillus bombycis TaxID=109264 RepID=A0A1F8AEI7_9EURO|nr:hypothetical protein ABOM_001311 [Aspergillus bombycis]OGM50077.1 hypothetical protein ABOM_001311 [Aspergillus bombycis]